MIMILAAYGGYKTNVMVMFETITIQQPILEQHFTPDYGFGASNGYSIAFGLSSYASGE